MFEPLRCHDPRGALSCGSPMPRGEQIARPAEWGRIHAVGFLLLSGPIAMRRSSVEGRMKWTSLTGSHVRRLAFLLTTGCLLSTCRQDSTGPFQGSPNHLAHATIGPGGGQVRSSDGRFVLQIPAGALSAATDIVVDQIADPSSFRTGISQLPFPAVRAGPVISIQSGVDTLSVPAVVTIPYDRGLVPRGTPAGDVLIMRLRASGQFELLSGGLD